MSGTEEFERFINWLEEVPLYGHKDGTRNMVLLMQCLRRRPDGTFPEEPVDAKVIHVAGTNGKGSCCAMLASVLQAAGSRVGLYTSPHLVDYCERIQVDGRPISHGDFARLGNVVKEEIGRMVADGFNHCTFFEILTAIAFLYFNEQKVDYIVLETGVGGRLDATNTIHHPLLTLITSISLDHTKVLGSTVEAIAGEKAGILRPGCPIVLSKNLPSVQQVVKDKAKDENCPYLYAGDVAAKADDDGTALTLSCHLSSSVENDGGRTASFTYQDLKVPLTGDYQIENVCAVLCCLYFLKQEGLDLKDPVIAEGLAGTRWPGRMQHLLRKGQPVLLDGAHNPSGASMLAGYLSRRYQDKNCTLVFSALAKKDLTGVLSPLRDCPAVKRVIFTCIDGQDSTNIFEDIWKQGNVKKPYRVVDRPLAALDLAVSEKPDLVICAGSLYLIGDLLKGMEYVQFS